MLPGLFLATAWRPQLADMLGQIVHRGERTPFAPIKGSYGLLRRAAQPFDLGGVLGRLALEQAQAGPHGFAGVSEAALRDAGLDEAVVMVGQAHIACRHKGLLSSMIGLNWHLLPILSTLTHSHLRRYVRFLFSFWREAGCMDEDERAGYTGAETTGFQSPAQDHIEHVIDLARLLDLQKPGIYPVRVSGQAFAERGIKDGDILIANTAALPAHGKVAVAVLQGSLRLATLERRRGVWFLLPSGTKEALPVSDDAEIWAVVAGLVRETV